MKNSANNNISILSDIKQISILAKKVSKNLYTNSEYIKKGLIIHYTNNY